MIPEMSKDVKQADTTVTKSYIATEVVDEFARNELENTTTLIQDTTSKLDKSLNDLKEETLSSMESICNTINSNKKDTDTAIRHLDECIDNHDKSISDINSDIDALDDKICILNESYVKSIDTLRLFCTINSVLLCIVSIVLCIIANH